MSKFIDKLKRAARTMAQPMGFGAARSSSAESRILLVASLNQIGEPGQLAESFNGADAVLILQGKSGLTANALKTVGDVLKDIPWGVQVTDAGVKKTGALVEAGCDFLVFPASGQVSALSKDEKVGKVLQVEVSLDDGLLRAINDLPVDAVLTTDVYEGGVSLSWQKLMQVQRLANLFAKPLLVPVPANTTAGEIEVLWEAGVDCVVVEADISQPGGLKGLRKIIDGLPARTSRKRGNAEPLLPRVSRETETAREEEEEDWDDE